MPAGTLQILGLGTSAVPLDYVVAPSQVFDLIAAQADFDGSAAGSDFVPVVQIISDAGEIMAQGVGPTITAGSSGSVTFAPFLRSATTGGGGITQINSSDGSILGGGTGPILNLTTFQPQIVRSLGTVTFAGPGSANVPWAFFQGNALLDYTTPDIPTVTHAGWYEVTASATFGPLDAPTASAAGTLTASGGFGVDPSSTAGGLGSATFGLALAWAVPTLRMKTSGGAGIVLNVNTDSAIGCVVNAELNVAWLRPG